MGVARLCHTLTQKRSAAWVSVLLTAVAEGLLQGPSVSRHVGFTRDNAAKKTQYKLCHLKGGEGERSCCLEGNLT